MYKSLTAEYTLDHTYKNATLFGTMQWMDVLHTVIVFGYLNSKNVLGYILMYLGTHLLITKWNLFGVGH